jgi:hypothetical protein
MEKYFVVLFKNKKRQRIIKKFKTYEKANSYFLNLLLISDKVIFDVQFENGTEVKYELALLTTENNTSFPVYLTDDMGRNIKVKLDDSNMSIDKIKPYRKPESIYDINKNKKITVEKFIKDYLSSKELKMISILNNKLIVQKDDDFKLFSLKSEFECQRFLEMLSNDFLKIRRTDCLFISDNSSPQRKYLLDLLSKNGFDKNILYRKFTTHPRPK